MGSEFFGYHRSLRISSYTFTGFHHWKRINHIYQVFHPRGYLSLLAITLHIFSFLCMQPCDSDGRHPKGTESTNQSPNTVLIHIMHSHPRHEMSPCIMQSAIWITQATQFIMCHGQILIAYNFRLNSYHVDIFMHTYINMLSHNYHQSCYSKSSNNNLDPRGQV